MNVEKGSSASQSVNVTVKDQDGAVMNGEITCNTASGGVDWLTFKVEGSKITFTASPNEDVSEQSNTTLYTVSFKYNGKEYLKTNYKVVVNISKLKYYDITVTNPSFTAKPEETITLDLMDYVKVERVFENGSREIVEDATFTYDVQWSSFITLNGSIVTIVVPKGWNGDTLNLDFFVEATADGKTQKWTGTITISVGGAPARITTSTLSKATAGSSYSQTLSAKGDAPITWSIISGSLPSGLKLNERTGIISGKTAQSEAGNTATFTVQASNSYGTNEREFSITVNPADETAPRSWGSNLYPKAERFVSKGKTFQYTRRVRKGENIKYKYSKRAEWYKNLEKYIDKIFVWDRADGAVKEGESYVKFTLKYKGQTHDYVFEYNAITAMNDYGTSYSPKKTITLTKNEKNTNGKLSIAAINPSNPADGLITVAADDDDDDEYEEINGVTYLDDGGVDEDGNITGIIGGDNAKYKNLTEFINSLSEDEYPKVIRLEFRKNAEDTSITANDLAKFTGLLELAIDESDTLTALDLQGNTKLESLSLFKCGAIQYLNVDGCTALGHLEAAHCSRLTDLDVAGCSSLASLWLNGSAVTNLDLSGSEFANISDIDVTSCNSLTALNVDGCAALSNLFAPYTAVTSLNLTNNPELTDVFLNETQVSELDLSKNPKLESLSLTGAENLTSLKLAEGVELDDFDLTDSKITTLDFSGNEKITSLDLSGNTELTSLNLAGCANLKELKIIGTKISNLVLTGCYSLDKLVADGCESLTELNLDDCTSMREIYLNGAGLKTLDAGACGNLISLDVSACRNLTSLNAKGCSLRLLLVNGCAKLTELDCSNNSLGWLNLDNLESLDASIVDYSGQVIDDWKADTRMKLSDYIGENDANRIIEINGYASDGTLLNVKIEEETAETSIALAEKDSYVVFETVPAKIEYLYDTGFGYGNPMDVTLPGETNDNKDDNKDENEGENDNKDKDEDENEGENETGTDMGVLPGHSAGCEAGSGHEIIFLIFVYFASRLLKKAKFTKGQR